MLGSRDGGRKLDRRRVGRLRGAMAGGRWRLRLDPISLDESGALVDGRHRLAAVVEADVRLWFFVTRGLPAGYQDPFADDPGARRPRRS